MLECHHFSTFDEIMDQGNDHQWSLSFLSETTDRWLLMHVHSTTYEEF